MESGPELRLAHLLCVLQMVTKEGTTEEMVDINQGNIYGKSNV